MRLLGLDIGQKRTGVAITDEKCTIAYPLEVLDNATGLKEKLVCLIEKYSIGKIVVGMPFTLKGQECHQAGIIREFVNLNLEGLSIPIVYMDERFTSRISEGVLKEELGRKKSHAGKTKKKRAGGEVDKISASIILSGYIERQKQKSLQ